MKVATIFAILTASIAVDAEKTGNSYRRRHLTTFEEVCFPTAAPVAPPVDVPVTDPVPAPVSRPTKGKGGTVSGPTTKSGNVYSPPPPGRSGGTTTKSNPPPRSGTVYSPPPPPGGNTKAGTVYAPPPPPGRTSSRNKASTVYTPPPPGRSSSSSKASTVYAPPPPARSSSRNKASTVYTPSPPGRSSSSNKASTVYSPAPPNSGSSKGNSRQLAARSGIDRKLQTVSLNTTFAAFAGYSVLPNFYAYAQLTFPDNCFSASVVVQNFIANCEGCSFLVADVGDNPQSCDPASLAVVTPFVDPTEISTNPYVSSTLFNTDSSGSATVNVQKICTGTGPMDNVERPIVLLDSSGQIGACGILAYVCP